jgi:hypothetical protein
MLYQVQVACQFRGPSWSRSYCSWIYNYLCNQCLTPLKLCVRIPFMARCTRYNIMGTPLMFTSTFESALESSEVSRLQSLCTDYIMNSDGQQFYQYLIPFMARCTRYNIMW